MKKVLVEIQDERAFQLLPESLREQDLNILKVLPAESNSAVKLSNKYQGALPENVADELNEKNEKSRNEWMGV